MKTRQMIELCILFILILLLVNKEHQTSRTTREINSTRISRFLRRNGFSTSKEEDVEKPPIKISRHQYQHNSSPFAVDGGRFARFDINHGLKELSWEESYRRNTHARVFGKRGKITLSVVDLESNPIPNAQVHYFFNISDDSSVRAKHVYTETDENGFLSMEGRCIDYVYFLVTKEGHYETRHYYSFLVKKHECYDGGHWIPWNPTLEVTLKPIRNPIKRKMTHVHIEFPTRNEPYGFDCEVGDLVAPYGKGIVSDFEVAFFSDITPDGFRQSRFTNEVFIVSKSAKKGFKKEPLARYSRFPYLYEPPNDQYESELYFCRQQSGQGVCYLYEVNPLEEGYYYVMRLREQYDEGGNLSSVHYGKIVPRDFAIQYDSKKDTVHLKFCYYFNPTANDRNMEGEDDYW